MAQAILEQEARDQAVAAWTEAWWNHVPHTQLGPSPTGRDYSEAGSLRWYW